MKDVRLVPLATVLWLVTVILPILPSAWFGAVLAGSTALAVAAVVVVRDDPLRDDPLRDDPLRDNSVHATRAGPRRRLVGFVRSPGIALVLLGAAVGSAVTALHVTAARAGPVRALAAESAVVTIDLEVRTDPRVRLGKYGDPYVVFMADAARIRGRGEQHRVDSSVLVTAATAQTAWQGAEPGQQIRTVARLAATEPTEQLAAFVSARAPPTLLAEPSGVDDTVNRLRAGLRAAVEPLPTAERGLLPSLVVGDVTRLPDETVEQLKDSGLTHLTAVSGANLTILLAFVLGIARAAGVRAWGIPLIGLFVVIGFVLVARPEPSVIRAAAMGLVGLAGLSAGSRRTGLPALAAAVIGLLLLDPWLGRSFGFALSVTATAGILVFAPKWTAMLERRLPSWLAVGIAVPLAAHLAVVPLLVVLSGEISVVAVLANLLAGPMVPVATVLGVAALLVAAASTALAQLPAWLAYPAVWWIVEVADLASAAPGASVEWPTSPWALVVLIGGCVTIACGAGRVLRRGWLALALCVAMLAWLIRPVQLPEPPQWLTGWPPDDWLVTACDVGQGDALVLNAGADTGVLVDAGPDPAAVDRCLRRLGIRQVPYVVLTHFHADHTEGLSGAIQGRDVGEVAIRPVAGPESSLAAVQQAAGQVPIRPVVVGERRRIGDVTLTILGPTEAPPVADPDHAGESGDEGEGTTENDASVVVLAEVRGVRLLLTGDIEPQGQGAMVRAGVNLSADVLKVPHHGARYQDPAFLDQVAPRVALISVGVDNDYGHPADTTLQHFVDRGIPVGRTDLDGAVAVTLTAGHLSLVRQEGKP